MNAKKWEYLRKVLGRLPADLRQQLYDIPGTLLPDLSLVKGSDLPDETIAALTWAVEKLLRQRQGGLECLMNEALALPAEEDLPRNQGQILAPEPPALSLEDVAIALMSFPPAVSALLFKELGPDGVMKITIIISRLRSVTRSRRQEALQRLGKLLSEGNEYPMSPLDIEALVRTSPSAVAGVLAPCLDSSTHAWVTTYLDSQGHRTREPRSPLSPPIDSYYRGHLFGKTLNNYLLRSLAAPDLEMLDIYLYSEFPPEDAMDDCEHFREQLALSVGIREMQDDVKAARRGASQSALDYLERIAVKKKKWLAQKLVSLAGETLGRPKAAYSRIWETWLLVQALRLPLEIRIKPQAVVKEWEILLLAINRARVGEGLARRFLFFCLGKEAWIVLRERKLAPSDYVQRLLTSGPAWFLKKLEAFYAGPNVTVGDDEDEL